MKLIGIGGTNGSGKDTLAQILVEDYGWVFVSVSDILREELKKRGLPIERKHLRALSAEWRRKYHHGHVVDLAVERFKDKNNRAEKLVVSSLRNPGEAERIHELGGQVAWVDADSKLRYKRIYSRQRSTEDQKTFEQFLAEEQEEMEHHQGDEATLSLAGVKAKADIFLTNDSDDIEQFKHEVKKALSL
ncbi:MAG TPA: AAA family ATPase [Candidatus Saccharimonadales bacterium]|nr:AAA family ATPase [Candidatus Saccharimonadales bacterium]